VTVRRVLVLAAAAALLVAGCGDDSSSETTTSADTTTVRVYLLRDGKVWPVQREVEESGDLSDSALQALRLGPTDAEQDLDLTTEVPENESEDLSTAALAQVVYTLTQFADADSTQVDGATYDRSDFEEQTPSVLVESPLAFEEVASPITATGTANTFEANFQYELLDADGNVIDENFVTATSGTGTRGTFEFTTADVDDVATLVVFESSAEDGSRMNEVEIPLNAAP
jgi:germination protein M